MHLHLVLLLFSSGVSSYFLPVKGTWHLQNKTQYTIIDEMLCLLEAENESINKQICAHNNTEQFIEELKKIPRCKCMKRVEKDMKKLEENCSILKKSSFNDERCSQMAKTDFSQFKESLKEFLRWVNGKKCSNIVGSELGLYPGGKCSCHDPGKYSKGLL
uniref:Interleukin-7 n=1 Tax=Strigops habroptila TaxID=2489341 RepID=A0A672TW34_STRHB